MVDFAIVPEQTALVNVDMQNCFVEDSPFSAPDGLVVLDRINRLVATCRAAGILIVHTSHVLRPDGSNTGVLGEIVPIVKQGIIAKGSKTAALHRSLVVCRGDILLDKPRFGAFHGTLGAWYRSGANPTLSRRRHHHRHGHRDQCLLRNKRS